MEPSPLISDIRKAIEYLSEWSAGINYETGGNCTSIEGEKLAINAESSLDLLEDAIERYTCAQCRQLVDHVHCTHCEERGI